jgi:cell division protein FtsW
VSVHGPRGGAADLRRQFTVASARYALGALVCLGIIGLFAFIVLRSLSKLLSERSLFVLLAPR